MKRPSTRVMLLLGATFLSLAFPSTLAQGLPAGELHLPDLITLPPDDIQIHRFSGRRELLFSNTVWNGGAGPLELRPRNDQRNRRTTAFQRVYTHSDVGRQRWVLAEQFPVGTFEYHPDHFHWHFQNFANYDLRNVAASGSIGRNVHRSSQKTTFCIIDTTPIDLSLEHAGTSTYAECNQRSTTGLSVGWGDTYSFVLPGQSIDITNLPDGEYWLVSTADMSNRLRETNDGNNWAAVKLRIQGLSVTVTGTRAP